MVVPIGWIPPIATLLAVEPARRGVEPAWLPCIVLALGLGLWDRAAPLPALPAEGCPVRVVGWIASSPETFGSTSRCVFAIDSIMGVDDPEAWIGKRVRLLVRTRASGGRGAGASGGIGAGASGGPGASGYGSRLDIEGQLRDGRPARNFGAPSEESALRGSGALAVLEATAQRSIGGGEAGPSWRREVLEPLRLRLRQSIENAIAAREAGILVALVVGFRDGVAAETQAAWTALGVNHILSISGMHVALVAGAVLAIAGAPRHRRGWLALVAATWGYAALGGAGPTVLRAAWMATWAATAMFLGRRTGGFAGLGVAVLALVLVSPARRHDLGLQLSCLATAGILFASPLATRLAGANSGERWLRRIGRWALAGAILGLAAQTATLPLQLAHFGALSWISPVANLVMVPLSDLALVLGLAGAPLALVSETLARPLLLLAGGALWILCETAAHARAACELQLFPRIDALTCSAATMLAIATASWMLMIERRRLRRVAGAATAIALLGLLLAGLRPAFTAWRFEALDVGQGDALVLGVETATWVIDAGDARPSDMGARVVVPHLRRHGVHRLRGLVLTHPHRDHCGGARSLLAAIAVDTLYMARASADDSVYIRLRREFATIPVRYLARGDTLEIGPGYRAAVLWPEREDVLDSGPNGMSIVLHASGGEHPEILAMGDLEADGEAALLQKWHPPPAAAPTRILKAGHHGSATSSTPAFLALVDPAITLLCVGERNRYGHPGETTLAALAASGSAVLRTDRGGAVRFVRRRAAMWIERPGASAAARLVDASEVPP